MIMAPKTCIRGHEFILVDLTTAKDYFDQALNINPRFAEALCQS